MPKQPTMLLCAVAGAVTAAILCGWTSDVSAQDCNDRYPTARGLSARRCRSATVPLAPQVFAPSGATSPSRLCLPRRPGAPSPQAGRSRGLGRYASLYASLGGEPFPIPAVDLSRDRSAVPAPDRLLPDERAARDDRHRSAEPLPLSGAGRRPGDPLRRRRRTRGLRLVGDRQHPREAGMARLVSAQGDGRSASPSCAGN